MPAHLTSRQGSILSCRLMHTSGWRSRRGFTLLEALMASGILLMIVVAVTGAVTAGQHQAYYAQQRIAGTLAAEELMGRLEVMGYHDARPSHRVEDVGEMRDEDGDAFPMSFAGVGREFWVTPTYVVIASPHVQLNGLMIRVRSFDANDRTLADISRFLPEPPVDTLSESEAENYAGNDEDGEGGGIIGGLIKNLFGW